MLHELVSTHVESLSLLLLLILFIYNHAQTLPDFWRVVTTSQYFKQHLIRRPSVTRLQCDKNGNIFFAPTAMAAVHVLSIATPPVPTSYKTPSAPSTSRISGTIA